MTIARDGVLIVREYGNASFKSNHGRDRRRHPWRITFTGVRTDLSINAKCAGDPRDRERSAV
jgi:hypothetical protein